TTLSTAWSAPSKGKPSSYIVYVNGDAKASTRNKRFVYSKLACGTTYTLEVAARDALKMVSARSKVSGTTAACDAGSSPSNPSNPPVSTGYAAAVLKDAPIAYWRLNETSGTRAADSVGSNHGTFENAPKLGASGIDGAVGFDGKDDLVTVADSADLRLNGSFTIEFLAKLGADANTYPGVLAKGSAATGNTGYIVYYASGRKNPAFKRAGVDGLDTSDAGALATDGFKHYAFTYDDAASTARWYVGGNLDRTISNVRFPLNLDSSTLQLGRGDSEGGKVQFGNEVLDEVAVYRSALGADRVKAHFDASGLLAQSTPVTPAPAPAPAPAPNSDFPIGVCAYKTQDFAKLQAIGMHHARMDQPSPQIIEQGRTFGVEVLPIADHGFSDLSTNGDNRAPPKPENRAAWAKRSVDTWRNMAKPPKVIEVWNEPWHKAFYGGKPNPADYLELVKAFAAEAWKVWPNVTLLVCADAGMSDYPTFRKDLLAADKDKFLTDPRILPTTHNYVENRTPTQVTGNSCTYDLNRYQCAFQDFKSHGHKNPQVWVTEFGWESNSGGQSNDAMVSEQQQAQFTVDALEMFRKSGMVAAAYSFMLNSNDKWNYNWLRPDNSEKPVVGMVKSYLATH
ncbi:MAG TPA: LamG-like jellyroll fold domain-containing protein, partial [Polyangiales bacterium]|nr:LamG-like jellyroll fold domain-containing protein [Polyangiales bacterium]